MQFSLRQKTRLGALRSRGKVLILQSLLWDDEVREADFPELSSKVSVSDKELKMSASLVESMVADFAPDQFSDDYQDQLRQLIGAKLAEGDALDTAATFDEESEGAPKEADVVDLMEALRRSVEDARGRSGATTKKPPAQKSTAKKPAKKSTAQKPAKKAS